MRATIIKTISLWALLMALAFSGPAVIQAQGPAAAADAQPTPLIGDALVPPPPSRQLSGTLADTRSPSQYMAGRVTVLLVLPESTVSSPVAENWTEAQIAEVTSEVRSALDWWTAHLPAARLQFELQTRVVPVSQEPITFNLASEGAWISEALANLGYPGRSYFDQAYAATAALRQQTGSDWATIIFSPNSAADSDGRFSDGLFAYAYIGGPFSVITSDAGPYGTRSMAAIVAHELGHTFGALDQYAAAKVSCTRLAGYLQAPTTNSQVGGCSAPQPSIMLEPVAAFVAGAIDPSALAQVGYRDSDGDGLIDPLDTTPRLFATVGAPEAGRRPIVSGQAVEVPFPSAAQRPTSINLVSAVQYRVDGGAWQSAGASDGLFDSAQEEFAAELPLYDGSYTVELRAVNSIGAPSAPVTVTVSVSGLGVAPAYAVAAPAVTRDLLVSLDLQAPAGTQAVQVASDPSFAGAAWQPFAQRQTATLPEGDDGPRALYVRFRDAQGLTSLAYQHPIVLDTLPPVGSAQIPSATLSRILVSAADDTSQVVAMEVQIGDGTPRWMPYQQELDIDGDPATVRVRFQDEAGNVSAAYSAGSGRLIYLPLIVR